MSLFGQAAGQSAGAAGGFGSGIAAANRPTQGFGGQGGANQPPAFGSGLNVGGFGSGAPRQQQSQRAGNNDAFGSGLQGRGGGQGGRNNGARQVTQTQQQTFGAGLAQGGRNMQHQQMSAQSQPQLFGAGVGSVPNLGGFGSAMQQQPSQPAGSAFGAQSQLGGGPAAGAGHFQVPTQAVGINKNRYEYSQPHKAQAQGGYQILGRSIAPIQSQQYQAAGQLGGGIQQPQQPHLQFPNISSQHQQPSQQNFAPPAQSQSAQRLPGMLQPQQPSIPSLNLGSGQPSGMAGGANAPPKDIAQSVTVTSGAFKVVALTKEQLRQVTQMKQQHCEPIVLQPKDIQFAISRTPNMNASSSKMANYSPVRHYGFESCALNTRVRRLPDGLGAGTGRASKASISPDKRTPLSSILVNKYLPTENECR